MILISQEIESKLAEKAAERGGTSYIASKNRAIRARETVQDMRNLGLAVIPTVDYERMRDALIKLVRMTQAGPYMPDRFEMANQIARDGLGMGDEDLPSDG